MESIQGLLDALAGAGPAVAALAAVFILVWRQFCALLKLVIDTIKDQAKATAEQATSNDNVAIAVTGLKDYLERQAAGDADYRSGMKEFARTMTSLAQEVDKKQSETLGEIKAHRIATEKAGKHPTRPA
jgi:hypothetical protein